MKRHLKKYLYSIFSSMATLFIMTACTDDITMPADAGDNVVGENEILISGSMMFPEAQSPSTRAFCDQPKLSDLDLYLVVFEDKGKGPVNNPLRQVKKVTEKELVKLDDVNLLKFSVILDATNDKAIIHLIALNDPNFLDKFTAIGGEYHILAGLNTSYERDNAGNLRKDDNGNYIGEDAYWQRVELGQPLQLDEADEINKKLGANANSDHRLAIPMVRNFAKVSVNANGAKVEGESESIFKYEGFQIINCLDCGTIIPFMADDNLTSTNITFFPFADGVLGDSDWVAWGYDRILKEKYEGRRASGATRINVPEEADKLEYTPVDKYIYERPFQSSNRTFVIIYGLYAGKPSYYKVDLGRTDKNNIFTYYNLIRNIEYKININNISGAGYSTALEAANGLASNNFSASVETRNLLNISDGEDMIRVNFTRNVFVKSNDEVTFKFQYSTGISDANPNGVVQNELVKYDGSEDGIGIRVGEVVAQWGSYEGADFVQNKVKIERDENNEEWVTFVIKCNDPSPRQKTQTFTIYNPQGLNRTITLILTEPWTINDPAVYAGQWDKLNPPEDYINDVLIKGVVGGQKGANMTLFFELPAGLPEVIFPLDFVIEADRQNIQNDYSIGSAAVTNGTSLFPGVTSTRIQYVKTVKWSDYDMASGEYEGTASHNVRARFLTITDLGSFADDETVTTIRISNPYFNLGECSFTRIQGQDPDPNK